MSAETSNVQRPTFNVQLGSGADPPAEQVQRVFLAEIMRSPFNRAIDPKSLSTEFIESIRLHGIIQPLIVRPLPAAFDARRISITGPGGVAYSTHHYELVAGERRWVAASLAGLHVAPVIVRKLSDTEAHETQLIENLQRLDLSPIEEAEGYERLLAEYLKEPGASREKAIARLCERVKRAPATVYERLRLLNLPAGVKAAVQSGALPPSQAGLVAQVTENPATSRRTVSRVVRYVLNPPEGEAAPSFRETKKFIDRATGRTPRLIKANPVPGAKFHAVAEQLYPCLCSHCKRAFQQLARGETPRILRTSGKSR